VSEYFLIDFGASFVKTAIYDASDNHIRSVGKHLSPLDNKAQLKTCEIVNFFHKVLQQETPNKVVSCCILGGGYQGDTYYSWKCDNRSHNSVDLVSGLFIDQATFHQHYHHHSAGHQGLRILGQLCNKIFYSSLADTECVRASVPLEKGEYILNLGTGSQILGHNHTHSYIPSGRALNVYKNFFDNLGIDLFEMFTQLSYNDIQNGSMVFDLNLFEQSHMYEAGGKILNIKEQDFTLDNFVSSVFKSYLTQYVAIFNDLLAKKIYLTGGISRKYPVISEFLKNNVSNDPEVILLNNKVEDTHVGISNIVRKCL